MKVLWLTNVPLTKVKLHLGDSAVQFGGWLDGMSDGLIKQTSIEFLSIFPFKKTEKGCVEDINYIAYLSQINDREQYELFKETIIDYKPDLIHIFGTEFKHALVMIQVCKELNILEKTIVNIQGLCSKIADAYYAGLPRQVINNMTLRDFLRRDSIKRQKKKFEKRGKYEIEALKLAKNVIGRTDWDKACTIQINSNLKYYYCDATLREPFYEGEWDYEKCEKHSIFVSQSNYPIKGFHKLLQAMPKILNQYPDAKIYTTGKNLLKLSFKDRLKLSGYQKYIIKLIKKYNLENHVEFLGFLDAEKMKSAYLKSNCFVLCSSIENESNALGEAMILGVPSVTSLCGGVVSKVNHNENCYTYPFSEEYMLAYYVNKIFEQGDCKELSKKAMAKAQETYNREKNLSQLLKIYREFGL